MDRQDQEASQSGDQRCCQSSDDRCELGALADSSGFCDRVDQQCCADRHETGNDSQDSSN